MKLNGRTTEDGMPSTRMSRRNFFVASSWSPVARDLELDLGWFKILLKEWAVLLDIMHGGWQGGH